MTVLSIRASKRFAIRRSVTLRTTRGPEVAALMVELCAEGCRLTNLGDLQLTIGQPVTVATGEEELCGQVRWAREGVAGIRLDAALHLGDLGNLVSRSRDSGPAQFQDIRRFGT